MKITKKFLKTIAGYNPLFVARAYSNAQSNRAYSNEDEDNGFYKIYGVLKKLNRAENQPSDVIENLKNIPNGSRDGLEDRDHPDLIFDEEVTLESFQHAVATKWNEIQIAMDLNKIESGSNLEEKLAIGKELKARYHQTKTYPRLKVKFWEVLKKLKEDSNEFDIEEFNEFDIQELLDSEHRTLIEGDERLRGAIEAGKTSSTSDSLAPLIAQFNSLAEDAATLPLEALRSGGQGSSSVITSLTNAAQELSTLLRNRYETIQQTIATSANTLAAISDNTATTLQRDKSSLIRILNNLAGLRQETHGSVPEWNAFFQQIQQTQAELGQIDPGYLETVQLVSAASAELDELGSSLDDEQERQSDDGLDSEDESHPFSLKTDVINLDVLGGVELQGEASTESYPGEHNTSDPEGGSDMAGENITQFMEFLSSNIGDILEHDKQNKNLTGALNQFLIPALNTNERIQRIMGLQGVLAAIYKQVPAIEESELTVDALQPIENIEGIVTGAIIHSPQPDPAQQLMQRVKVNFESANQIMNECINLASSRNIGRDEVLRSIKSLQIILEKVSEEDLSSLAPPLTNEFLQIRNTMEQYIRQLEAFDTAMRIGDPQNEKYISALAALKDSPLHDVALVRSNVPVPDSSEEKRDGFDEDFNGDVSSQVSSPDEFLQQTLRNQGEEITDQLQELLNRSFEKQRDSIPAIYSKDEFAIIKQKVEEYKNAVEINFGGEQLLLQDVEGIQCAVNCIEALITTSEELEKLRKSRVVGGSLDQEALKQSFNTLETALTQLHQAGKPLLVQPIARKAAFLRAEALHKMGINTDVLTLQREKEQEALHLLDLMHGALQDPGIQISHIQQQVSSYLTSIDELKPEDASNHEYLLILKQSVYDSFDFTKSLAILRDDCFELQQQALDPDFSVSSAFQLALTRNQMERDKLMRDLHPQGSASLLSLASVVSPQIDASLRDTADQVFEEIAVNIETVNSIINPHAHLSSAFTPPMRFYRQGTFFLLEDTLSYKIVMDTDIRKERGARDNQADGIVEIDTENATDTYLIGIHLQDREHAEIIKTFEETGHEAKFKLYNSGKLIHQKEDFNSLNPREKQLSALVIARQYLENYNPEDGAIYLRGTDKFQILRVYAVLLELKQSHRAYSNMEIKLPADLHQNFGWISGRESSFIKKQLIALNPQELVQARQEIGQIASIRFANTKHMEWGAWTSTKFKGAYNRIVGDTTPEPDLIRELEQDENKRLNINTKEIKFIEQPIDDDDDDDATSSYGPRGPGAGGG